MTPHVEENTSETFLQRISNLESDAKEIEIKFQKAYGLFTETFTQLFKMSKRCQQLGREIEALSNVVNEQNKGESEGRKMVDLEYESEEEKRDEDSQELSGSNATSFLTSISLHGHRTTKEKTKSSEKDHINVKFSFDKELAEAKPNNAIIVTNIDSISRFMSVLQKLPLTPEFVTPVKNNVSYIFIDDNSNHLVNQTTKYLYSHGFQTVFAYNVYYCSCCECAVPGYNNLEKHIKGRNHNNIKARNRRLKNFEHRKKKKLDIVNENLSDIRNQLDEDLERISADINQKTTEEPNRPLSPHTPPTPPLSPIISPSKENTPYDDEKSSKQSGKRMRADEEDITDIRPAKKLRLTEDIPLPSPTSRSNIVCKYFAERGSCWRGDKCWFRHEDNKRPSDCNQQ